MGHFHGKSDRSRFRCAGLRWLFSALVGGAGCSSEPPPVDWPSALPYFDLATGERCRPEVAVASWVPEPCLGGQPRRVVGYGMPLALSWKPPAGAVGELLSYRSAAAVVRQEVTGTGGAVLHLRGRVCEVLVEALGRGASGWFSHFRQFPVGVRGLLAHAGQPGAVAGHADGVGPEARFTQPCGVAIVAGWAGACTLAGGDLCIVADSGSHVLRSVAGDGTVSTPWGSPFEPGHRDSPGPTRFRRPSHLAELPGPCLERPWARAPGFLVADSGNHVIRRVLADGTVSTLAGVPERSGHRDATEPGQALFCEPAGLAVARSGHVYVADRGNQVIRVIHPEGTVTTLAGLAGSPGTEDGRGPRARFSALAGLALDGDGGALFVADGHSLRRVSLAGEVSTLLGVAAVSGFADLAPGGGPPVACLNGPEGLALAGGCLLIADRGNQAIRSYHPATGALRTLAGTPDSAELRCGLLRDGMEGELDPEQARLAEPRGLASNGRGDCLVTSGTCLLQLLAQHLPYGGPEPPVLRLPAPAIAAGQAFQVELQVPTRAGHARVERPFHYRLDFLEADGSLGMRLRGEGLGGRLLVEQGRFCRPGAASLLVQAVTDQGVCSSARLPVAVR